MADIVSKLLGCRSTSATTRLTTGPYFTPCLSSGIEGIEG
jgi:hypothetical protein